MWGGCIWDFQWSMYVDINAALIPLAEFSDPVLMKRYELKPAPEVIDIVSTAAKQKNVWFIWFCQIEFKGLFCSHLILKRENSVHIHS